MPHPGPRAAAYALALLFALAIAIDLLGMPIQVADSIGELLDAQHSPSVWASLTGTFGTEAYLRPVRIGQIKMLFEAAQGTGYWLAYRGFHALLLVAALLLFTRALRVSTVVDFGAAAFALVVLIGLHTFRGTVHDSFGTRDIESNSLAARRPLLLRRCSLRYSPRPSASPPPLTVDMWRRLHIIPVRQLRRHP